jgi:hypothetical protein
VSRFADITTALSGALAQLPVVQSVVPVLDGLTESTTLTSPLPADTDTTGSAGLTPLHLALPAAALAALTDPAVSGLVAALTPTQLALTGLGLPAVTAALTGSLGSLGSTLAGLPSGSGLAGLHTVGVDVSLVGLSTAALHHRSPPAPPPGGTGGTAGIGGTGGITTGGGTGTGGTVSTPVDPPGKRPPNQPGDPPAGGTPPHRTTAHSPLPSLPFTGDNVAIDLAAALVLFLVGSHLLVVGRRRSRRAEG